MIKLFTLFFTLTIAGISLAQGVRVKNYTTRDGLSSPQVYDIIQDDFGYIWFSTDKGLSRYNGYEFENFDKSDGLTDNVVFDFLKRPDGKIWCSTNHDSFFYFDGADPKFHPYKWNDTLLKYKNGFVTRASYFSQEGDLYINLASHIGYLRISKNGEVLSIPKIVGDISPSVKVKVIRDDLSEPLFFMDVNDAYSVANESTYNNTEGSEGLSIAEAIAFEKAGVSVFIRNNFIRIQGQTYDVDMEREGLVISTGKLDDDKFWIGYRYGGVRVFDLKGNELRNYLPQYSVTQLFQDDQGNSWISTLEKGVFRILNTEIKTLGSFNGRVSDLNADNNEELYIGMYNGNIWERNRNGDLNQMYQAQRKQLAKIAFDKKSSKTYFCSDYVFSKDKKFNTSSYVRYLEVFGDHILYGNNFLRSIHISDEQNGISPLKINRILDLEGLQKDLYFTNIDGFYKIKNFPKSTSVDTILSGLRIDDLTIWEDKFVLGSNGSGLIILDKNYRTQARIKEKNGLNSNFVSGTFAEDENTLWVATNQGINRVSFDSDGKYSIQSLSANDGLISNEIRDIVILRDTVWVGTQRGVNYFSIKDFERIQAKELNIRLQWKSILVNSKSAKNRIAFDYDQNSFDFSFIALLFQGGQDLSYRYKLIGQMSEWKSTNGRSVNFSALAPGSYTMVVQAKTKNGKWGRHEINYTFEICAPFWSTWWFLGVCVILIAGIIYLFFKIRVLSYNEDIVREIMRYTLQKIRKDRPSIIIKSNGKHVKLLTESIHFAKTDGNYLEVHTDSKVYLVRSSIAKFAEQLPDEIEFLQVHRSYLVRIDRVQEKGKKELIVLNDKIPIGKTYLEKVDLIRL